MHMDRCASSQRNYAITLTRGLVILMMVMLAIYLWGSKNDSNTNNELDNYLFLQNIPANRWVKYHHLNDGDWWRKGHAGLAYDSARGSLLVFGSDTHGEDWDNIVHEFIPRRREWVHHGVNAGSETYRVNSDGYPVAGGADMSPWAMHTYDGVEYDPSQDALVVVASPSHNPIRKQLPKRESDPVWIYHRKTSKWSIFSGENGAAPRNYFGAATAFDKANNDLFFCKSGLWALNLSNQDLCKIGEAPNCLHRSMAFDSWRRQLYVFGAYEATSKVLRYQIGYFLDEPGNWQELTPGGDHCPPNNSIPVAFDEKAGVFLLVIDEHSGATNGKTKSSISFVYDPVTNSYQKLEHSQFPPVGMNFMLAWDQVHEVFFLLTGNWKDGMSVWALRLDRSK